jgi:uncharacterized protein (TIRG00374 family)
MDTKMIGRIPWYLAGLGVGALSLWLSGRGLDWSAVLAVLQTASVTSILLAMLGTFGFMALKAWRWSVLLEPRIRARPALLHWVVYVGSAANLVVVHSGELLRALIVGRRLNSPPSSVLASIGLERVFDMFSVLTLVGVLLLFDFHVMNSIVSAGLVAAALALGGMALMLVLLKPTRFRKVLTQIALKVLPVPLHDWVKEQVKRGLTGVSALGNPRAMLRAFVLSILQWGCIVAVVWVSVQAVGTVISVTEAIGVWVLMVIGLTLPSSPAQIGTTQLAYTIGLALSPVSDEVAFAASVIYTFTVNVPIMLIGAACWLRVDRSDLRLRAAAPPSGAGP